MAIDKLAITKAITEEKDENIISSYLTIAEEKLLDILYPFRGYEEITLPPRYDMKCCEIAAYLLNKRGAEGETKHSENGVSRDYADADIPRSMLRGIVPKVGIIK